MAACSSAGVKHVILTGPPGIGKTTLIHKVCQALKQRGVPLQGFYTEEQRDRGRRIGFDVVTLDGHRGQLARIGDSTQSGTRQACCVGQYVVQVKEFEQVALPALTLKKDKLPVYIIDEIGKMELFSQNFVKSISEILAADGSTVLATIPIKRQNPIRFVEDVRNRKDVKLFEISKENRNLLLEEIVKTIESAYQSRHAL